MIIDSSAILAIIGKEPSYERIVHELAASSGTWIGAATRLEGGIVLTARFGPRGKTALARFLQENSIQTVAFDDAHASVALDAYSRFGKGRHPAALNFGDCFPSQHRHPDGVRAAIFYTKLQHRLLGPLLAASRLPARAELRTALATIDRIIAEYVAAARLEKTAA